MATSTPPSAWSSVDAELGRRVDDVVGAELLGELQLLLGDVDGDHGGAGDLGVLQRQMTEAADAEHGDEFGRTGPRHLHRLVGGDSGTGQRGGVERVHAVGDLHDERRGGRDVVRVAAVDAVAGVELLLAQRLPAGDAELARAARNVQPRDGDPLADPRAWGRRRRRRSMMPTPSCPGTNGGVGFTGQSPLAAWMSVWQSPDASSRTTTSPGPGVGMGRSSMRNGAPSSLTTAAFMISILRIGGRATRERSTVHPSGGRGPATGDPGHLGWDERPFRALNPVLNRVVADR